MNNDTTKNKKEIKKTPIKVNILIIGIIFIIAVFAATSFYLEFHKKNSLVQEKPTIENKTTGSLISKAEPTAQKETVDFKKEVPEQEILICSETSYFIIDYLKLHLKAEQGLDFAKELLDLRKHLVKSKTIKKILNDLSNVSSQNNTDSYFAPKFNSLIKTLYIENEESSNVFSYYLNKYLNHLLFIRPIGNRAIKNGGFDMNITLAYKSLLKNDLEKALEYIEELPNKENRLLELKQHLITRIYIKNSISQIDDALKLEVNEK